MRFFAVPAMALALAACQPTPEGQPVSAPQAPTAASAQIEAIGGVNEAAARMVAVANAKRGEDVGTGAVSAGATQDGNKVTFFFEARSELAEGLRSAPRGEVQNLMRTRFSRGWCANPNMRAFIESGGEIETVLTDSIGRRLAAATVTNC